MVVCFFFLEIHVVFSVPSVVPPREHLLGDLRRLISFNLSVSVANSCLLPQSDEEKGLKNTSGSSFVRSHPKEGEGPRKSILCGKTRESFPEEPPVIAALEWKESRRSPDVEVKWARGGRAGSDGGMSSRGQRSLWFPGTLRLTACLIVMTCPLEEPCWWKENVL